MSILDAILLGLIQGLTEFIPVSSSGHLILLSELTSVDSSFEFDVLVNIGTLAALLIYFRARLKEMYNRIRHGGDNRLARNIVISTVPAVIVGGLFADFFERDSVRSVWVVAAMLFIVGVLMIIPWKRIETAPDKPESLYHVPKPEAFYIGLAQVLALIPGTSRSGITMIAGRLSKLSYSRAAEYSFLMGIPVFVGAIARTLVDSDSHTFISQNWQALAVGNIVAFVAGLLAISFVMKFLKGTSLWAFGVYRIALAIMIVIISL